MINRIHCYPSANELVAKLSEDFLLFLAQVSQKGDPISIAFSGGKTPAVFFEKIAADLAYGHHKIEWELVHFFWVDERCVNPGHPESNFGLANKYLFSRIGIEQIMLHRIRGEDNPAQEAVRYGSEIMEHVKLKDSVPLFDWIFLGLGDDGHTASIFPNRMDLLTSEQVCEAVTHPTTGQFRITMTGLPLMHAKRLTFLATGTSKSKVISQIVHHRSEALSYPAARIFGQNKNSDWYLDQEAANRLNHTCHGEY